MKRVAVARKRCSNTSISRVFVLGALVRAMLLATWWVRSPSMTGGVGNPTTVVKEHFHLSHSLSHSFFGHRFATHVCQEHDNMARGSMSEFRVVETGGPIRDVAVEPTTNPLQNLCRTASQSLRKKSTTEFAENFPVELDNDRNHSRTSAIRPWRPDSTVGKPQMCTCRARKRCQNLTSTMKNGVATMWTTTAQC